MDIVKIQCIICEAEVENWARAGESIHPLDGTQFRTYGHFGSYVFDPMDGSFADICICTDCLTSRLHLMVREVKAT